MLRIKFLTTLTHYNGLKLPLQCVIFIKQSELASYLTLKYRFLVCYHHFEILLNLSFPYISIHEE